MNKEQCPAAFGHECLPASCHGRCAIEVIDELLRSGKTISGEQADWLLDLRWYLSRRDQAEAALRCFANLRLHMESFHYLAFFRLRRWMEHHIVAQVKICPAAPTKNVSITLNSFCIEAVRRQCLCRAIEEGAVLLAPRLAFTFVPALDSARVVLTGDAEYSLRS